MASPETQSLVENNDSAQLETEQQPSAHQRSPYTEIPISPDTIHEAPQNSAEATLVKIPELQVHGEAATHEIESLLGLLRHSPLRQWWMEIMCCLLMIGTLLALVATLDYYNGEVLPNLPFDVSVNTIISILGTTLKANAGFILAEGIGQLKWQWFRCQRLLRDLDVFDRASRGPWGCAKLLVARPDSLSSFAAILTILTLAIDPFTQQLISYDSCKLENTMLNATLPRANVYFDSWPIKPFFPEIDRGIFSPTTIKAPFSCPSGNCTFHQPFTTVGFCSVCEDMTRQLKIENVSVPFDSFDHYYASSEKDPKTVIVVNASLPSGSFGLSSELTQPSLNVSEGKPWFSLEIIQPPITYPNGGPIRGSPRDCQTEAENSTWECAGFGGAGAARCAVRPCVKSYEASVEQGQLKEEIVATHLMDLRSGIMEGVNDDRFLAAADLNCAGTETVSRLQKEGFSFENKEGITRWDAAIRPNDGKVSLLYYRGTSLLDYVGSYPGSSIGRRLSETNLPADIIPAQCLYVMRLSGIESLMFDLSDHFVGSTKATKGPSQLLALYNEANANFDSINTIFANIAESLTQRIRQHGVSNMSEAAYEAITKSARGKVFEHQTCISVRWGYFAFPATLVVLTTAFLSFVVARALMVYPELEVAAGWKSSPLPMVLCGLDLADSEASRVHVRAEDSVQEMERISNTITGRLKMN